MPRAKRRLPVGHPPESTSRSRSSAVPVVRGRAAKTKRRLSAGRTFLRECYGFYQESPNASEAASQLRYSVHDELQGAVTRGDLKFIQDFLKSLYDTDDHEFLKRIRSTIVGTLLPARRREGIEQAIHRLLPEAARRA